MAGLNAVVASPVEISPGNVESFFSWSACEECGNTLGGDRYTIQYRESLKGDLFEADVCPDCFVNLCG